MTDVDCAGKLHMLRAIGADGVIGLTLEDFTRRDEGYAFIFDILRDYASVYCAPWQGGCRPKSMFRVCLYAAGDGAGV